MFWANGVRCAKGQIVISSIKDMTEVQYGQSVEWACKRVRDEPGY